MSITEQIDELLALSDKATPGPVRSMRDGNQYVNTSYLPTAKVVGASRLDGLTRPWNPHALMRFGFRPEEYETARFLDGDADYIAAIFNRTPALLRVLKALMEERSFAPKSGHSYAHRLHLGGLRDATDAAIREAEKECRHAAE